MSNVAQITSARPQAREQKNAQARAKRLAERRQRVAGLLNAAAEAAWEFRDDPYWRALFFTIVSVSGVHEAITDRRMVDAGAWPDNLSPLVGGSLLLTARTMLDDGEHRAFDALRAEANADVSDDLAAAAEE